MRLAIARDAAFVAERPGDRFAERERRILDRMVLVDVKVALHAHRDVDQRMARQLLDHMVEEADAGGHRIIARAVEIDGDRDIRFLGRTLDGGGSHGARHRAYRSEEHTSELQSLMRISYAVFC